MRRSWETGPGLLGWLGSVDHKEIGKRYIYTAFAFFLAGGVQALLMRAQLARPENGLLSPELYNQFFSMHGTTMIFLFATPIQSGIGNFVLPLMLGSRDMAFPRLNAFGYWVFLFAGLFMYSSYLLGGAPAGGWFNYVPLTGPVFSPGWGIDFYTLGLIFLGISTTAGAINFIVSTFKLRAPGMSINRLPLLIWSFLTTSFVIIFALPALTTANALLFLDRRFGTHVFDPAGGGNVLLWQHLFWIFGHPDVYIIFLPAVGMVSSIVPTFARRPMVGYTLLVLATVATGIISFGVWAHHMFAVGLTPLAMAFFGAASLMIAIPSGIQVFAWLGTMLGGRVVLASPLLFVLGFLVLFVIGGVTGVMFAAVPFDWQATDSYFVVAHFHYVLIGGAVFPIFAGLHYWFPKMTGRMLDERIAWLTFWVMFVGFNLAFFPMHILGLLGMPRRVYTYQPDLGWDDLNLLATMGAFLFALGVLIFVYNVVRSLAGGEPAGDNPWDASTLEWATTSPPPPYNFLAIPVVHSREPLWDPQSEAGGPLLEVGHRTLGTSVLDADPTQLLRMPKDSLWPLALALSLLIVFVGLLVNLLLVVLVGLLLTFLCITGWLWPPHRTRELLT